MRKVKGFSLWFSKTVMGCGLPLFLLVVCSEARAFDKANCAASAYSEAYLLSDLPAEVRVSLQKDRFGLDELSDKGGDFNSTDVGAGPHRRFALAAVSPTRILVAVEHGGRGYFVELWEFEQNNGKWRGEERQAMSAVPNSSRELAEGRGGKLCATQTFF